jgi:hypothetical protein
MRFLDSVVDDAPERAGELVRAQIRNRLGWAELEHFNKTGEFLAKHPLVQKKKLFYEMRNLKTTDPKAFIEAYAKAEMSIQRYNSQLNNEKYKNEMQRDLWLENLEVLQEKQNIIYALIEETNAIQPNSKTKQ